VFRRDSGDTHVQQTQDCSGRHALGDPHLIRDGAGEAIDFYTRAFGATEVMGLPGPDGRLMHGRVKIGDSVVMLVDEDPFGHHWAVATPQRIVSAEDLPKADAAGDVCAGRTMRDAHEHD